MLIDDDSGLEAVLARRFRALGWDATALPYAAAPEELAALRLHVALVEAVLRRRRTGQRPADDQLTVAGELEIRPDRFDVYGNGRPAALSRKEFELVALLAAAEGRVLEREDIYQRVWGYTMARGGADGEGRVARTGGAGRLERPQDQPARDERRTLVV